MAVMHCLFSSEVLKRHCAMNVVVPEKPHPDGKRGFPVIYLLHGRSGDENSFLDRGLRPLAERYGFIVVMPGAARSFYMNMRSGEPYWSFISEELPDLVGTMFPARTDRADTFAGGISMGGYGALKLGLSFPERFSGVAAFSAVADIAWAGRKEGGMTDDEIMGIFGGRDAMIGTDDDLFVLLRRPVPSCGRPAVMMRCGDRDGLVRENRDFIRRASDCGWMIDYAECPGAGHNWDFWTPRLNDIFDFFQRRVESVPGM